MRIRAKEAKEWARAGGMATTYAPLTTPFTPEFKIDEAALRENIRWCMQLLKVTGMYTGGQLSEPFALSNDERMLALEIVADEVGGKLPVYAYPVCDSLPETIKLTLHAQSVGAAFVMVNPPFEHVKSDEVIFEFYKILADNTDIPISLYNTWHSGYIMPPELIKRLAEEIPAVCGIKNVADFEHTVEVWRQCRNLIQVNPCVEKLWLKALTEYEGMGLFLSQTAVYLMQVPGYTPIQDFVDLALKGEIKRAREVHESLEPLRRLWHDVYSTYPVATNSTDKESVPKPHAVYHPVAAIKCWEDYLGMHGGQVKPPTTKLSANRREEITRKLEQSPLAAYVKKPSK